MGKIHVAHPPVKIGEVISGRYRIDRLLGAGSMGFVVAAWHLELDQPVALKLLNSDVFEQGEGATRFRREVRAAARIKSEHVCRVIDVGSLEQGAPFMVMELLDGNNLEEELTERGPLPVSEATLYILEAVEALAEAHAAGIVHRDLKPANLFLARRADRTRLLKVLDFGISKSMVESHGSRDMSLTKTGVIIGSPLYMSPEQMRSTKDADTLSDVWALGAILFQLITGRPPYEGETIPELCAKLFTEDAPPPSTVRAGLPANLDAVLHRALARDSTRRFQNVAELGAALVEFAPGGRIHVERARRVLQAADGHKPSSVAPGPISSESPTIQASVSAVALWSQLSGRERRRRWALVAAAVLAVAVAGLTVMRRQLATPDAGAEKNVASNAPEVPRAQPVAAAPVATVVEPVAPAASVEPLLPPSAATEPAADLAPSAALSSPRPVPAPVARPRVPPPAAKNTGSASGTSITDFGGRR
jgi:serine/threonine protein kinase